MADCAGQQNYKRTTPQHRRDTAARVFARQTASSAQIYAAEVNATLNAAVNALELRDALQAQCDNSTIGSSNSTVYVVVCRVRDTMLLT